MELVSLVKELLQSVAERAASYRLGQSALRCMDRALWIVEKSARWAVPPPLDLDERPQPELIRPLPWVFFLALLIMLRITRESISLVNLALGKPPLRPADVVTYIQGKRRYLRTLKYQGNRMMRARTEAVTRDSWYSHVQSMFEFTMCFRRQHYGNNNTQLINGDEMLVVKRNKRPRPEASTVASTSETSMERLIEKMMVDVDVDSDESSSYTLTNLTSGRSDKSDYNTESDQEITSDTKTPLKQSQDSKSIKETQDNTSLADPNTETSVKQSLDSKNVRENQDNNSLNDSNTKTSVKQSIDNKTVKEAQDNTSLADSNTKTSVKQSLDSKTVKETQDNNSLSDFNTKKPVKQGQDGKTEKETQDYTSLADSNTKTPVKQGQDSKTEKETQDHTSLADSNSKTPVKQGQDSKTEKETQDHTSLADSNSKTPVKQGQDSKTEKETKDYTSLTDSNTKTSKKQSLDSFPKEIKMATSTPKKNKEEKFIDFDPSNDSISRLEGDNDNKQEKDSDTKEATMDFIQNEIGTHRSEDGYRQYKIANGLLLTMDLTTTER